MYIYIYVHTHTHTHTYIDICRCRSDPRRRPVALHAHDRSCTSALWHKRTRAIALRRYLPTCAACSHTQP